METCHGHSFVIVDNERDFLVQHYETDQSGPSKMFVGTISSLTEMFYTSNIEQHDTNKRSSYSSPVMCWERSVESKQHWVGETDVEEDDKAQGLATERHLRQNQAC